MKFYIYYRQLFSAKEKENMGILLHVDLAEKDFSPDGETWSYLRFNRPSRIYERLKKMLKHQGPSHEEIYTLDGGRTIRDIVRYMNSWKFF